MLEETYEIAWSHGRAQVQSLGAMVGPIDFDLGQGHVVRPMAVAPWGDDTGPDHDALPGILKRLRGEWPCVPFGAPSALPNLPPKWQGAPPNPVDPVFHGLPANQKWHCV